MGAGARYESVQVLVLNPRLSGNSVYIYTHTHTQIRPFHLRGLRFGFSFSLLLFFSRLVYLVSLLSPLCVDHGRWCEIWVSTSSCLKPKVVRELCIYIYIYIYIYTHTHTDQTFSPEGFTVRILFLSPSLLLATRISRFTPFSLVCRPWALVRDMSQYKFLS